MQFRTIIKILGQLVALFSITMVPPALVSLIYKDGGGVPFVLAFIFSVIIGLMAYYPNRHEHGDLKAREGFFNCGFVLVGTRGVCVIAADIFTRTQPLFGRCSV